MARVPFLPRLIALLSFAAVSTSFACSARSTAGLEEELTAETTTFTVRVLNQNFYDATILAVAGEHRQELGRVLGNTTQTLTARWVFPDVLFEVRLLAGGASFSQSIQVEPGEEIELRIPGQLR